MRIRVIPAIRKPASPVLSDGMDPGLGKLDAAGNVTKVELLGVAAEDVEPLVAGRVQQAEQLVQLRLSFS